MWVCARACVCVCMCACVCNPYLQDTQPGGHRNLIREHPYTTQIFHTISSHLNNIVLNIVLRYMWYMFLLLVYPLEFSLLCRWCPGAFWDACEYEKWGDTGWWLACNDTCRAVLGEWGQPLSVLRWDCTVVEMKWQWRWNAVVPDRISQMCPESTIMFSLGSRENVFQSKVTNELSPNPNPPPQKKPLTLTLTLPAQKSP